MIPLFRIRNSALCSLYRLYENLCSYRINRIGSETGYFFYHPERRWALSRIPDPKYKDSVRYAILANLVDALVDAFNWRLELGLRRDGSLNFSEARCINFTREEAPSWTLKGALEKRLSLHQPSQRFKQDNAAYLARNMEAPMDWF